MKDDKEKVIDERKIIATTIRACGCIIQVQCFKFSLEK